MEQNLAKDENSNKKRLLQVHQQQNEEQGKCSPDGAEDQMTKDMDKAKVLSAFFASVFMEMTTLQESQAPEPSGKTWNKANSPSVGKDQVREHFNKLDRHKPMMRWTHKWQGS